MHLDNEIAAKQSQCNIGLENNMRAAIQALEDFDLLKRVSLDTVGS